MLDAPDKSTLQKLINEKLRQGYILIGGIFQVSNKMYCQHVIRNIPVVNDPAPQPITLALHGPVNNTPITLGLHGHVNNTTYPC